MLLHLLVSDLQWDVESLSRDRYPAKFTPNWPIFHSYSMNIARIPNLNARGERAHKTAEFTCWPWHDTIRTQKLNWSQRCGSLIVRTTVRFQPRQNPTDICPVRVTNPPRWRVWCFWPGLKPNRTEPLAKNSNECRLHGPAANTSVDDHFWEVVAESSLAFLPIKGANIVITGVCRCRAFELSKRQDQKALTLRWRSFWGGGSVNVTSIVDNKRGQHCEYGSRLSLSPWIIQDARRKILYTLLTLVLRRW